MTASVSRGSADQGKKGGPIIDVDAHENPQSLEELLPHLTPHWQRYISEYGWTRNYPLPFTAPTGTHPWENRQCPKVEMISRDLLDGEGVDIAIINNAVDPFGAHPGWYELNTALAHAYNDWVVANWLDKEPRLRGSIYIVPNDPVVAAREIDRVAAHSQMVQVAMPAVVDRHYGEPQYHPIYEAAERNGLAIAMHHCGYTKGALGYGGYFIEWHATLIQAMMCQIVSFIVNGVFDRFPGLKVVGLESGFTWLPGLTTRLDRQYVQFRHEIPWVKRKPSDHIRSNVRLSTQPMEDLSAKQLMNLFDMMGSDEWLLFSTDYPHYDGDRLEASLPGGLPDDVRRKIFSENAIKTYPRLAQLQ